MKRSVLLLAVLSITLFAGCRTVAVIPVGTHTTVSSSHHSHPPLHPSHGYRHHYHDHELVYDSDFGAYLVLGYDDVYYYNNLYFRFYSGAWQSASRLGGTWRHAEHRHLPGKLRDHKRYKRHHRHSPPPHAPAHGHRHSHNDGVNLIFDSGIGAYIALGFDDLFFFDNRYMRYYDGYWHYADRYDGRWHRANDKHIPRKLRKARRHNKNGLFKKIKKQYNKEHRKHREDREYRKRHGDRWNHSDRRHDGKGKHDGDRRKNGKYDKRGRDHRDDRYDRDSRHDGPKGNREKKGGLFSKTKKQYDKENRKRRYDDEENDRRDREGDRDRDRDRDRNDNNYRR